MNYFYIDQIKNSGVLSLDDRNYNFENIIEYRKLIEFIYPIEDLTKPFKIHQNSIKFPVLDFFEITSGKLPINMLKSSGWLPRGFIIKQELYLELNRMCSLAPHEKNETFLIYGHRKYKGYYYCFFYDSIKYVDFKNTTIKGYNRIDDCFEFFSVNSIEELLLKSKEKYNFSCYFEKVTFTMEFPNYDIFGFFHIDSNIYFSQKVKLTLDELKKSKDIVLKESSIKFEKNELLK